MELGAGVAEALLVGAEGTEVLNGLGDDVVEELEVDAAAAGCERMRVSFGFVGRRACISGSRTMLVMAG